MEPQVSSSYDYHPLSSHLKYSISHYKGDSRDGSNDVTSLPVIQYMKYVSNCPTLFYDTVVELHITRRVRALYVSNFFITLHTERLTKDRYYLLKHSSVTEDLVFFKVFFFIT